MKRDSKYYYVRHIPKDLTQHYSIQRLSKGESVILEKSDKLGSLIKELTDDKDNDFKIIKVNTKGDKNG